MTLGQQLTFGPFRLDVDGRLWRGAYGVALRPRAVAVLRYLVEHPGRLVTKAELLQQVWGDTHVTDTVLRVCVREIRAALGDAAAAPQYVETVGQEGYRFLGGGNLESAPPLTPGPLVGRQREVERLEGWFQRAASGQRQLGLISGEVGIGKTTVIELFSARLAARSGVRVGRGQCIEHYGAGEPYLPWLEALGRLARGPGGVDAAGRGGEGECAGGVTAVAGAAPRGPPARGAAGAGGRQCGGRGVCGGGGGGGRPVPRGGCRRGV